uniref:WAP domain-containing protein n=1 Tax=Sinocyclocheilus anshuiensis TaxID=1608454 RepID=A0A671KF19_9TELE
FIYFFNLSEWKCSAFGDALSCVCITAKPGKCPPRSSRNRLCTSSCRSDSNCPNNEKCCSNGCGRYCTAPYTVKPGQCPNPTNIPLFAESCFHDGQCPTTQKCCPTTSVRACSEPRGQGSGYEVIKVSDVVREIVFETFIGILHNTYWRSFQFSALFMWHVFPVCLNGLNKQTFCCSLSPSLK